MCDTWKGGIIVIPGLSLLASSNACNQRAEARYNYRGERQRVRPYLSWEWDALASTMTACDNSVSRRQYSAISICLLWKDTQTVGAGDEWDISPHLIHFFSFPGRTIRTSEMNEYGWVREHRRHTSHAGLEVNRRCGQKYHVWFPCTQESSAS